MTQKQQINAAAAAIAKADGWSTPAGLDYVGMFVTDEANPRRSLPEIKARSRAMHYLSLAEAAFEAITGDSPDYSEEEENTQPSGR